MADNFGAEGSAKTFDAVRTLLDSWNPEGAQQTDTLGQRLSNYLDASLNTDDRPIWEQDIIERRRGSLSADVVVNGEIGIAIIGDTRASGMKAFQFQLKALSKQFNYIAIYWWDISDGNADVRRIAEQRNVASRYGLQGLSFHRRPYTRVAHTGNRTSLTPVLEPWMVLAFVTVVIATLGYAYVGQLQESYPLIKVFFGLVGGLLLITLSLGIFLSR
ncbi:hypothetical protein [Haladaptatus sp. CMSO5]|uniref:hypothetical protein n=1 Tax=Haladaptatus sp. CMSO5 TaxID=3120514 RepID=UPI002FCE4BD9